MERVLEVTIDEAVTRIRIRATLGAARIYRTAFGRDLIEDIIVLQRSLNGGLEAKMLEALNGKDIDFANEEAVTKVLMESTDFAALVETKVPTFDEMERVGQVLWAFAKNADGSIPGYEGWIGKVEDALTVSAAIIDELYQLWTRSSGTTVALKNA